MTDDFGYDFRDCPDCYYYRPIACNMRYGTKQKCCYYAIIHNCLRSRADNACLSFLPKDAANEKEFIKLRRENFR